MKTNSAIPKAGGIILRKENENTQILMIFRNKLQDWSFPKGHMADGETAEQTAIREVLEETGLTVSVLKELPAHEYINNEGNPIIAHMFLMTTTDSTLLRVEHKGDILEWVSTERAKDLISYDNLKMYLTKVLPLLQI
jgi:8-oxo-dGTP pyrophosphatase MutT (NUDIX family)